MRVIHGQLVDNFTGVPIVGGFITTELNPNTKYQTTANGSFAIPITGTEKVLFSANGYESRYEFVADNSMEFRIGLDLLKTPVPVQTTTLPTQTNTQAAINDCTCKKHHNVWLYGIMGLAIGGLLFGKSKPKVVSAKI